MKQLPLIVGTNYLQSRFVVKVFSICARKRCVRKSQNRKSNFGKFVMPSDSADENRLVEAICADLRRQAKALMRRGGNQITELETTDLVQETCARLVTQAVFAKAASQQELLRISWRVMSQVLADYWRRKKRRYRDRKRVIWDSALDGIINRIELSTGSSLNELSIALDRLFSQYPREASVLYAIFFENQKQADVAAALGLKSTRRIHALLEFAKTKMHKWIMEMRHD